MNMSNTPTYIYNELTKRGTRVEVLDEDYSLMRYYHRGDWHTIRGCVTGEVTAISQLICQKKTLSEKYAQQAGMPVPPSMRYESFDDAMEFIGENTVIVVKPADGAHGKGVSTNVSSKTELKKALSRVRRVSKSAPLLQKMVKGKDVRILIMGGKFTAAVRRVPASVIGDGKSTVRELIEKENQSPKRVTGKRGKLGKINFDAARAFLRKRLSRVPKKGEVVEVVAMGNTSLGGHGEDFTEQLPAKIYKKAEKFAKLLNLPVCGVDIMLDDESGEYYFIEANASPGFGPHHHPRVGQNRRVVEPFVDMLLAGGMNKS